MLSVELGGCAVSTYHSVFLKKETFFMCSRKLCVTFWLIDIREIEIELLTTDMEFFVCIIVREELALKDFALCVGM